MLKLTPRKPLRVVVFYSGGASSFKWLQENDPNFDQRTYQIIGAFTDRSDASGTRLFEGAGIEVECLDFKGWCRESGVDPKDLAGRVLYFEEVCSLIAHFKADIIMCSGFMLLVTDPLFEEYRGWILNVHPADLRITTPDGSRKYTGMNAVANAIEDGATETRSTIHVVTAEVDGGPIVVVSSPLLVEEGVDPAEHQERMKTKCDGPAYAEALVLIKIGLFQLPT